MIDNLAPLVTLVTQMVISSQLLAVVSAAPSVPAGSVASLTVNVLIAKRSLADLILWEAKEPRERE